MWWWLQKETKLIEEETEYLKEKKAHALLGKTILWSVRVELKIDINLLVEYNGLRKTVKGKNGCWKHYNTNKWKKKI